MCSILPDFLYFDAFVAFAGKVRFAEAIVTSSATIFLPSQFWLALILAAANISSERKAFVQAFLEYVVRYDVVLKYLKVKMRYNFSGEKCDYVG